MVGSPFHPEPIPEVPLHHALLAEFQKYASRDVVVDSITGKTYTFQQLIDSVKRFACGLYKLGVRKGDVVAIFSPNTIDYPVWLFGAISVGATVTTANPHYTKYELRYHIKDSTARWVLEYEVF